MKTNFPDPFEFDRSSTGETDSIPSFPRGEICDGCGRHISELNRVSKNEDAPDGQNYPLLTEIYRPMGPPNPEAEMALKKAEEAVKEEQFFKSKGEPSDVSWDMIEKRLIEEYGKKKTRQICCSADSYGAVAKVIECKDCSALSTEAFYRLSAIRYNIHKLAKILPDSLFEKLK